ncbi:uncharacterized protein METZ01_LOCUS249795, partial [marine metagenome]
MLSIFRLRILSLLLFLGLSARSDAQTNVSSGVQYDRFVIRNAIIVEGNGTPAIGPFDIVVEGKIITSLVPLHPVALKSGNANRPQGDREIDATGKYVLPGLINAHGHVQESRGGIAQPLEYELSLWLACGITTVRDVGSNTEKTLKLRADSDAGKIAAPRLLVYARYSFKPIPRTPDQARKRVQDLKA